MISHKWTFINDLPSNWADYASSELPGIASIWRERAEQLKGTPAYNDFMAKMRREIAIETGIIERLYTIDRGITHLLIEEGIDEALIRHGATDRPASEIVALIRDQELAVTSIFDFVAGHRALSTSYIKELHALLTRNQATTDAVVRDTGAVITVELRRGEYKTQANNPQREDGSLHEYCPAEHVAAEMDNLVGLHLAHRELGVPPEVEAAWLHHRFTQIHPFQDGNGRVARCLASLAFIQEHWFPLTIRDEDRRRYLSALEVADQGDLLPLIALFTERQKQSFLKALSLSEQVVADGRMIDPIIASVRKRIVEVKQAEQTQRIQRAEHFADRIVDLTNARFHLLETRLRQELLNVEPTFKAFVASARNGDGDRSQYHSIQVIETAKRLNYFANRQAYSSWVQLVIMLPTSRVDLLVSVHVVGHTNQGVYVATACAYHKDPDERGETLITNIEPLSESPFQFSFQEDEAALSARFSGWLDDVISLGLSYWERSV